MGGICCRERNDEQPTSSPTVVFTSFTTTTEDAQLSDGCVNNGLDTQHDIQEGSGNQEGIYDETSATSSQAPSRDTQTKPSADSQSIPSTDAPTPPITARMPPSTDGPMPPKTPKADVKGVDQKEEMPEYDDDTEEEEEEEDEDNEEDSFSSFRHDFESEEEDNGFDTQHDVQEGSGNQEGIYDETSATSSQAPSRDTQTKPSAGSQSIPSTDEYELYDDPYLIPNPYLQVIPSTYLIYDDPNDTSQTKQSAGPPSTYDICGIYDDHTSQTKPSAGSLYDDPYDTSQTKPSAGSLYVDAKPPITERPMPPKTPKADVKEEQHVVKALHDWVSKHVDDLTFKKGDVMVLMDETYMDPDWCMAVHVTTHKKGYIPRKYVAVADSLESMDWFHGKQARKDCEKQLMMPDNIPGTFCIRISISLAGQTYVLSILDDTTEKRVQHYKISPPDDKGEIYASKRAKHATLQSLVEHHINCADGLCCRLTHSCCKLEPTLGDVSKNAKDVWNIPRSELTFDKKIGHGNFGEVWKGKLHGGQTMVAIKELKSGSMDKQAFLEEAAIMKKYNHEKLVRLYAVCAEKEPICIVTELMCNGDFLRYLRSDVGQELDLQTLIYMIAQIASGMAHLESKNFVHRDLAARNILVGENNEVKVADFGLAKIIVDKTYVLCEGSFPVKWTAPEAANDRKFSIKSDVWSFGILVYEIVTHGGTPYPGMSNIETLEKVKGDYRIPQPFSDLSEDHTSVWDMQMKCWDAEPQKRPTFEELLLFYNEYNVSLEGGYEAVPFESATFHN